MSSPDPQSQAMHEQLEMVQQQREAHQRTTDASVAYINQKATTWQALGCLTWALTTLVLTLTVLAVVLVLEVVL